MKVALYQWQFTTNSYSHASSMSPCKSSSNFSLILGWYMSVRGQFRWYMNENDFILKCTMEIHKNKNHPLYYNLFLLSCHHFFAFLSSSRQRISSSFFVRDGFKDFFTIGYIKREKERNRRWEVTIVFNWAFSPFSITPPRVNSDALFIIHSSPFLRTKFQAFLCLNASLHIVYIATNVDAVWRLLSNQRAPLGKQNKKDIYKSSEIDNVLLLKKWNEMCLIL